MAIDITVLHKNDPGPPNVFVSEVRDMSNAYPKSAKSIFAAEIDINWVAAISENKENDGDVVGWPDGCPVGCMEGDAEG